MDDATRTMTVDEIPPRQDPDLLEPPARADFKSFDERRRYYTGGQHEPLTRERVHRTMTQLFGDAAVNVTERPRYHEDREL